MFQLSICADTVFLDVPFSERVQRINSLGFSVEFWGWRDRDLTALFDNPDIQVNGMSGVRQGSLVDPDGLEAYLTDLLETASVANKLKCQNLILVTGELGPNGEVIHTQADHPITRWITAYKGLCQIAEIAEKHNLTYCVEHLNLKVDHAGYSLPYVEDAVRLVEEVGSPRIKILLDLYHAQVEEGNIIQLIRDFHDYVGYIHVADVPGRHEPGTGEMNYPLIVQTLHTLGYNGPIGLEAFPATDSQQAIIAESMQCLNN
ncbi:MAG: TIM barrel protein [Chloroflexota bacterium]